MGGLAFPKSSLEKKAIATVPSLPQPMRSLILFVSDHHLIALSDGRNEERKEERKVKTKKARAALAAGRMLQPFATRLSVAPSGMKDE